MLITLASIDETTNDLTFNADQIISVGIQAATEGVFAKALVRVAKAFNADESIWVTIPDAARVMEGIRFIKAQSAEGEVFINADKVTVIEQAPHPDQLHVYTLTRFYTANESRRNLIDSICWDWGLHVRRNY